MWIPPLLTYRTSESVIGPPRAPPLPGPASCIVSPGWQPVYPAARSPCQWSASGQALLRGRPHTGKHTRHHGQGQGGDASEPSPAAGGRVAGGAGSCERAAQQLQYELEPASRIANEGHDAHSPSEPAEEALTSATAELNVAAFRGRGQPPVPHAPTPSQAIRRNRELQYMTPQEVMQL